MDMTAAVRPYANLLASHAVGSGNVSINQSWNTGGNLDRWSAIEQGRQYFTHMGNIFFVNI